MTSNQDEGLRLCPFCKEDIKADAIKCKHCASPVQPDKPDHQGECPFCKETIKPGATRCKHCKSDIGAGSREQTHSCDCHAPNNVQYWDPTPQPPYGPGDFGQGCFDRCMGTGNHGHNFCEQRCQISMPNVYARPTYSGIWRW